MKHKSVSIMGRAWKVKVFTTESFKKTHPEPDLAKAGAVILCSKREFHFINSELSLGTVRHEVRHAYIHEHCLESANLTLDQFEEIICSMDESRWDQINKTSKNIFNIAKKLKK